MFHSIFFVNKTLFSCTEGKISGELKAFYWNRYCNPSIPSDSIFTLGVMHNYKTGSLNSVSLGLMGESNNAPFSSSNAKQRFGWYEYGSGVQLSEAYLAYHAGKTTVQVGQCS